MRFIITILLCQFVYSFGQDDCQLPDGSKCPNNGGLHMYPDPDDCTSFYLCRDECPEHKQCAMNFLFSSVSNQCANQDEVECGSRPCEDPVHCSPPTTTEAGTTKTTSSSDCGHFMDCVLYPDGWYADPYNCRKYWNCLSGKGTHYLCDSDYLYDPDHIYCDYPNRVDCGDRQICDNCDENCYDQPQKTTTTNASGCKHVCTEDGLFAEGCCINEYCQCFAGNGFIQHCPTALVFRDDLKLCDFTSGCAGTCTEL